MLTFRLRFVDALLGRSSSISTSIPLSEDLRLVELDLTSSPCSKTSWSVLASTSVGWSWRRELVAGSLLAEEPEWVSLTLVGLGTGWLSAADVEGCFALLMRPGKTAWFFLRGIVKIVRSSCHV